MADEDIAQGEFVIEYVGEGDISSLCSVIIIDNLIYILTFTVASVLKHNAFCLIFIIAVIDDKTCEERLWNMKHRGETNFYLCEINRDMVIDATYKGNKSRYINHSCSPNTEMQKWFYC